MWVGLAAMALMLTGASRAEAQKVRVSISLGLGQRFGETYRVYHPVRYSGPTYHTAYVPCGYHCARPGVVIVRTAPVRPVVFVHRQRRVVRRHR